MLTQFVFAQRMRQGKFFSVSVQMNVFSLFVFSGTTSVCQGRAVRAPVAILLMIVYAVLMIQNRILGLCCLALPWHATTPHRKTKIKPAILSNTRGLDAARGVLKKKNVGKQNLHPICKVSTERRKCKKKMCTKKKTHRV